MSSQPLTRRKLHSALIILAATHRLTIFPSATASRSGAWAAAKDLHGVCSYDEATRVWSTLVP